MVAYDKVVLELFIVAMVFAAVILLLYDCWIPNTMCKKVPETVTGNLLTPEDLKDAGYTGFSITEVGLGNSSLVNQRWRELGWQKSEYALYINNTDISIESYAVYFSNSSGAMAAFNDSLIQFKDSVISDFPKIGNDSFAFKIFKDGFSDGSVFLKENVFYYTLIDGAGEQTGEKMLNDLSLRLSQRVLN